MINILPTLTGVKVNNPRDVIEKGWGCGKAYNTGCLIKTSEVHSICSGVVLAVERDPKVNTWTITVEINSQRWVRYCLMGSFKVNAGQSINKGDLLGFACKGLMRFEYCTADKSDFPVRALDRQLYKHDPSPVLFGQEKLEDS